MTVNSRLIATSVVAWLQGFGATAPAGISPALDTRPFRRGCASTGAARLLWVVRRRRAGASAAERRRRDELEDLARMRRDALAYCVECRNPLLASEYGEVRRAFG